MKHPFAVGAAVGVVGLLAWYKRGWISARLRALRHPLSGLGGDLPTSLPANADPAVCVRQLRRYAFAALQDKSPIVGLTHASYALVLLDTLEEMVGRDTITKAGYNPASVRELITKLQDKHAAALNGCDPFLTQVLAAEKAQGVLPGFVLAGGAPLGA